MPPLNIILLAHWEPACGWVQQYRWICNQTKSISIFISMQHGKKKSEVSACFFFSFHKSKPIAASAQREWEKKERKRKSIRWQPWPWLWKAELSFFPPSWHSRIALLLRLLQAHGWLHGYPYGSEWCIRPVVLVSTGLQTNEDNYIDDGGFRLST